MFYSNHACFMNESLDFHLSTSTFSNPIFDSNHFHSQFENDSEQQDQDNQRPLLVLGGGDDQITINGQSSSKLSNNCQDENGISSKDRQSSSILFERNHPNQIDKEQQQEEHQKQQRQHISWAENFCDNLVFAIKSKMYVWELNFKNKLRHLKKFASGHLPLILSCSTNCAYRVCKQQQQQQRNKENNSFAGGYSAAGVIAATDDDDDDDDDAYAYVIGRGGKPFCSIGNWKNNMKNMNNNNFSRSWSTHEKICNKFWQDFEPNSKDSLGVQQEKILYRLEQFVQAKRNKQIRDQERQQQQQQQQQNQQQQQAKQQNGGHLGGTKDPLFNMSSASFASTSEGLRFIRPMRNYAVPSSSSFTAAAATTSGSIMASSCNPILLAGQQKQQPAKAAAAAAVTASSFSKQAQKHRPKVQNGCAPRSTNTKHAPNGDDVCIICYSNPPNILTLPCKHHEICSDCFIEIIYMAVKQGQYPLKCVLCRQKIQKIKCLRGSFRGFTNSMNYLQKTSY